MLDEKVQAEKLKAEPEIRRELDRTEEKPETPALTPEKHPRTSLLIFFIAMAASLVSYYILRLGNLCIADRYLPLLERASLGAAAIFLILIIRRAVSSYLIDPLENNAARYNLRRVAKLLAGMAIVFIAISVVFANWYTAVVSFGLISLILGFALQTPITSFIGWIYILIKVPYSVGDRIKIGEATGDVIDVSYLDTTLWEFGGPLLSTVHHPSGRIIKFPNSKVLSSAVYNYSWSLFPYIWNDIKFQIAYQSDLSFVSKVMSEAAEKEVGEAMMGRVRVYRELLSKTAVDKLEVKERPSVIFRIGDNTWVEAIVRYLVEPRLAGAVKTRLIKTILEQLNAEPGKVLFPRGDQR